MTIFFTSDLHLQHTNIIKYCKRPFENVDVMNESLIAYWNSRVTSQDIVYFLGDLCLGKDHNSLEHGHMLIRQLRGQKFWIYGNHDHKEQRKAYDQYFQKADNLMQITIGDDKIVLCHYPLARWNADLHGSWMLYGHVHPRDPWFSPYRSCCVGVDAWDYAPVSYEELKPLMNSRPVMPVGKVYIGDEEDSGHEKE